MSQAPADVLAEATARLALAADGIDVPGNVDAALRAILAAAHRDTSDVTPQAVERALVALIGVGPAIVAHFHGQPSPSLVDLALRSVGGVVRTFGVSPDDVSPQARESIAAWFDWAAVLLAEMDIAVRCRRLAARAGYDVDAFMSGPSSTPAHVSLH